MKVLIAAEDSGSFKELIFPYGTDTSVKDAPEVVEIETFAGKGRKNCIDKLLVFASKQDNHQLVAVARRSGQVEIYDATDKYKEIKTWDSPIARGSEEKGSENNEEETSNENQFEQRKPNNSLLSTDSYIVGFDVLNERNSLISCTRDSRVVLYDLETFEAKEVIWGDVEGNKKKNHNASSKPQLEISIFKVNPFNEEYFGYGGNGTNLTISKLNFSTLTLTQSWKSKNVKNDRLDLAMPIIINDIFWINEKENEDDYNNLLTLTGDGFIRQYNPSKQMRPINQVKIDRNNTVDSNYMKNRAGATGVTGASKKDIDLKIRLACAGDNEDSLIYTDNQSTIVYFDFKKSTIGGKYPGPTGNIQALYSYKNEILAAGGLDRYLRLYNITTREQIAKIYTGTHITSAWIIEAEDKNDKKKKRKTQPDDDNPDELWDELDQLSKPKKKKSTQ